VLYAHAFMLVLLQVSSVELFAASTSKKV